MRKIIGFLTLISPLFLQGQINFAYPVGTARGGAITATANDWEVIGINPSNLGWGSNDFISGTIGNLGLSVQSEGLTFANLKDLAKMNPTDTNDLANALGAPNGTNVFGDFTWAAFSIHVPKIGGFAIDLRDRIIGNIYLNPAALNKQGANLMLASISNLTFTGSAAQSFNNNVNLSTIDTLNQLVNEISTLVGSKVSYYQYRELNIDYGTKLFQIGGGGSESYSFRSMDKVGKADTNDFSALKVYGGVGVKYLWGIADLTGTIIPGGVKATYAVESANEYASGSPIPDGAPGSGVAFDIGGSAQYRHWNFSVAATDLGSITWHGTAATVTDTNVARVIINNRNNGNQQVTINDFVQSSSQTFTTQLPSKLRFGANYQVTKRVGISSDVILPLNNVVGNLVGPYMAVATHITIVKSLAIDGGFATAQQYGFAMPFGLTVGHKFQFYIATNDILTYLGKETKPDISAAFALIRVNF